MTDLFSAFQMLTSGLLYNLYPNVSEAGEGPPCRMRRLLKGGGPTGVKLNSVCAFLSTGWPLVCEFPRDHLPVLSDTCR